MKLKPGMPARPADMANSFPRSASNVSRQSMAGFRHALFASALFCSVGTQAQNGQEKLFDFNDMPTGDAPAGFEVALSGEGEPAAWIVVEDKVDGHDSRSVRQISAVGQSFRFPLCVLKDLLVRDVRLTVRFKPVSGAIDQAAGMVWRYRDPGNYYVVRANALEGNVVLYKMENGRRSDIKPVGSGSTAYGKDVSVPRDRWSTLRVDVDGEKFSVWLNGGQLFDVEDDTFREAGRVGLWTKADSVTSFDDFAVTGMDDQ